MSSRLATLTRRSFILASLAVFSFFGFGCGGGGGNSPSFSSSFTASTTTSAVRLIKLVPKSNSGARVVIQAVIYGPDATLDMYSFAFDVKIGDTTVLGFVSGSAVAGNALVATGAQTKTAIAGPDASDSSHIVVGVTKLGGGAGNGVAGSSAVVVELAFDVLKQGTSTLAIAASPAPSVGDQDGDPIGSITFDSANGSVTGISTGGGY